ncbi:hypothetical protein ES703_02133 [subsurface metagenome]
MSQYEVDPKAMPLYGVIGGQGGIWAPLRTRPHVPYFTYYAMSRAAMMFQNIAMNALIANNIDVLSGSLPLLLGTNFSQIQAQFSAGETGHVGKLKESLVYAYKGLYQNWKAGVWHGVGTAYSSAMEQFMATGQFLYAYKALAVQTAVTPRLRRHWMQRYTPTVPNISMAWLLWKRGVFKETDFNKYASYEGWPSGYLKWVKAAFERWPSIWASVRLWQREQITTAKLHDVIKQEGYSAFYYGKFEQLYRPLPTIGQAARMFLRSSITDADYMSYTRWSGWTANDAQHMMVNYLTYPTPREANYMWRRNFIDKATRNKFYKAQGYLESMHDLISLNYTQIFNPLNAFKLRMRGALSFTDYAQAVYENRWGRHEVFLFDALYQNIPTSQEAFYMWAKGQLNATEMLAAFKAYGWMEKWHGKLIENYWYVPTLYDLFRIADSVEIDEIWAADVMTRRGIRPSDQAKLYPMLKIRPLRDEIRRQVLIWLRRYQKGWASDVQLDAALDDMIARGYIMTTEKTLITQEAYLMYEDELVSEQITVWMWYYRMAAVTEAQYLAALISLGIRREKANLMVEEQTAMGYYGYY